LVIAFQVREAEVTLDANEKWPIGSLPIVTDLKAAERTEPVVRTETAGSNNLPHALLTKFVSGPAGPKVTAHVEASPGPHGRRGRR
jgi:hypothetical protein